MTILILCISRQIQFVNVYDNTDGICYSADESTDVMIMKTDAPFALKDSSVRLRKPSVSKCFEADPKITFVVLNDGLIYGLYRIMFLCIQSEFKSVVLYLDVMYFHGNFYGQAYDRSRPFVCFR
ncbi:hypothetical protein EWB00_004628 [Schistosoma japonicum]|uniref:Uncharacterized protein n=1 Tax=Schistosoma japonicum TaxID=6182 RepID=A0A4Z2D4I9_SCHJA|nr:hypothetical protein EWB00_004628 [Schistosoma japonicum]